MYKFEILMRPYGPLEGLKEHDWNDGAGTGYFDISDDDLGYFD